MGLSPSEQRFQSAAWIAQELSGYRERNRELRTKFEELRVELSEPQPVEFHFCAWTQRDAAVLRRALYQIGFLVRLLTPTPRPDDPDRWSLEAGANIPLTEALGDELAEKLVRLAPSANAVFDGWGASI